MFLILSKTNLTPSTGKVQHGQVRIGSARRDGSAGRRPLKERRPMTAKEKGGEERREESAGQRPDDRK